MKAMRFLLIISHDERFAPTEALVRDIMAWIASMTKQGIRIDGNPLRPPTEAATVRVRRGRTRITEGPIDDAPEKICAYELIECADREAAIAVAASHPMAKAATIEVRPVWSGLGA